MKHALIRGVLGSDQYICIDSRFGHSRIVDTVREAIQKRRLVLPRRDCFTVDVFNGPRVGEGGIVMTMTVGSPINRFEYLHSLQ
ncbi:MAG: hypothetical protein GWN62_24335 [Aliifodinibius sp.]|nr:hypothetical protein [Fodinibius sp.]